MSVSYDHYQRPNSSREPKDHLPGLAKMYAETPAGLCPFCLDPIPAGRTKPFKHCGDPICGRAYNRTYGRDRRRKFRAALAKSLGKDTISP